MNAKELQAAKERMIHVRLPVAIHKKVRVHAAEADETIQEWVFEAIKQKLETRGRSSSDSGDKNDHK